MFTVTTIFVGVYDHTHTFARACDACPNIDNDTDCFVATNDS